MIICQLRIISNQNKESIYSIIWFLGAKVKTEMCEVQKEKKIGYNKIKKWEVKKNEKWRMKKNEK